MSATFTLRSLANRQHGCRSCQASRRSTVQCAAAARSSSNQALSTVTAAAAAALIQLTAANLSIAAPAYDYLPGFGGAQTQDVFGQAVKEEMQRRGKDIDEQLDEMFDENLMTDDLRKFVDAVLGNKLRPEQYQAERLKVNFRRELDGRVTLRSREGQWYNVRPDLQAAGFMLLRDGSGGVYYLPPADEVDGLAQLDLSDDVVVAELFSNTAWQDVMRPFAMRADDGSLQQLRLTEREFRDVVSLVDQAEEPAEEEAEAEQQPAQ